MIEESKVIRIENWDELYENGRQLAEDYKDKQFVGAIFVKVKEDNDGEDWIGIARIDSLSTAKNIYRSVLDSLSKYALTFVDELSKWPDES
jgi:hypothetical protein